jgi:hypothetical protein
MKAEQNIIVASEAGIAIRSFPDILEVVGATYGANGLLLTEADLSPDFFDLRTGLAGEAFQKFTNYELRVAVVLGDYHAYGQRFSELAYEHSAHPIIRFFNSGEAARAWLSR